MTWLSIGSRSPASAATREVVAGAGEPNLPGANEAACRLHTLDHAVLDTDAGNLAMLDDVHAAHVGCTRA